MEIRNRRSILGDRLANNRSGTGVPADCRQLARFFSCGVDFARDRRNFIPYYLWVVDRIHRLHMALESRQYVEGFDVCLCQSNCGGLSGVAAVTRKS